MAYIFFSLFFVVELVAAWQLRSFKRLVDKNMLWFWLSIFFSFVVMTRGIVIPEDSIRFMIIGLTCSMFGTFSFTVYVIFRGIPTVFRISREGEQHPTCLTLNKLTQHPLWVYFAIAVMTLLSYSERLYNLLFL